MRSSKLIAGIALTLGILTPPRASLAGDWPQFLGPYGNGHSDERLASTDWSNRPPLALWSAQMHDNGYAAPAAAAGKVFIVDHEGTNDVVRALNLRTGQEIWRFAYYTTNQDWFGHALATPAFSEGRLFTLSRDGQLHCLDGRSGTKVWARNIITTLKGKLAFYRMVSSPVIDGEKLIVCPGGESGVAALDKVNGKVLWTSPNGEPMGHASPVIATLAGTKQYLIFTGLNLLGLRASNGHKLWSYPWKTQEDFNTANPVVVGPDQVLIGSTDNGTALLRLGPQNQVAEVWRNRKLRNYFGTPLVRAGLVFAKDDSQSLVCLNLADGQEQWRQPKFGTRWCDSGGLLLGDKILITNGRTGDLFLVEATGSRYHQLAWLPSPAGLESLPAPVLADGILLLRSKKQLVALQLPCSRSADVAAKQ